MNKIEAIWRDNDVKQPGSYLNLWTLLCFSYSFPPLMKQLLSGKTSTFSFYKLQNDKVQLKFMGVKLISVLIVPE